MHSTAVFLVGVAIALIVGWRIKRFWIALPVVVIILLLAMAAQAQASTRIKWSQYDGYCYRYSVTEYRSGVSRGLLGDLWNINQRLDWCQPTVGGSVVWGPVVHRHHYNDAFWVWSGYQVKTSVQKLSNPTRWTVYVKAAFTAAPDLWGLAEHNYPWIRMTIYKANPTHAVYSDSCGC